MTGDKDWNLFCNSLGFQDLPSLKENSTQALRVQNKKRLEKEVSRRLRVMNTESVERALLSSRVPFSRFNSAKTLLSDPQFKARGLLSSYSFQGNAFSTIVNPALINGKRPRTKGDPPDLGEHTSSVLREVLGLGSKEIKRLSHDGVVKLAESARGV